MSVKIIHFLFYVGFLLFSIACHSSEKQNNTVDAPSPATISTPIVQSNIPVYKTFEDMAYIFEYENDTTYLINFWATWCKPCVAELPYFEALGKQWQGRKFKIILVSLDFPKQIDSKLKPFVEENKLHSDVIALTDGKYNRWIDKVDENWSGAIPASVIYNARERKFIEASFHDLAELEAWAKSLLGE